MTPLYADLALRTSDALGVSFAESFVIPHRYGDLTRSQFRLGKLTDTLYIAADHPMESITEVFELGQKLTAWTWYNKADSTGRMVCFVELSQPASAINSLISASGRGKLSPRTGALMENPAEIIQDLIGINERNLEFPLFFQECARRDARR